ncbi:hypothetical protein TorRG33x02_259070 [Trema orientale]|uniref:Uncharacterized protein n=1 Tax=Trema orientale TaxID=63057 RepID=A0A2P5D854_TREOI|nr:hypothetical protein TorRG33x02_259070 [Trema orientale]
MAIPSPPNVLDSKKDFIETSGIKSMNHGSFPVVVTSNLEALVGTHTTVTSSYHSVAFTTFGTLSAATTP